MPYIDSLEDDGIFCSQTSVSDGAPNAKDDTPAVESVVLEPKAATVEFGSFKPFSRGQSAQIVSFPDEF